MTTLKKAANKSTTTVSLFALINAKMVEAFKAHVVPTDSGDITLEEIFSKEAAEVFDAKKPEEKLSMFRNFESIIRGLVSTESACFTHADKMLIARKLKNWVEFNESLLKAETSPEGAQFEDAEEVTVLTGTLAEQFVDQADKIIGSITKIANKHGLVIKCKAIGYTSDTAGDDFSVAPLLDNTADVTKNVTRILKGIGVIYSGLEKRELVTAKLDKHMDSLVKLVLAEVNKASFTKEQHRLALQGRFQITEAGSKKAKASVEKKQGFASRTMSDVVDALKVLALEVPREIFTMPKASAQQRINNIQRSTRTATASNILKAIIA